MSRYPAQETAKSLRLGSPTLNESNVYAGNTPSHTHNVNKHIIEWGTMNGKNDKVWLKKVICPERHAMSKIDKDPTAHTCTQLPCRIERTGNRF